MTRNYETIIADLQARITPHADPEVRMQAVVDLLWDHLYTQGLSWVGFYLFIPEQDEMVLGPRRDQPACSPIGMHGACGAAFLQNETIIVRDVKELGENYIACDPKDRSEIVLPIADAAGQAIGVLDLDSFEIGSFGKSDAVGLAGVLTAAGLGSS